jgi:hypothetical protein
VDLVGTLTCGGDLGRVQVRSLTGTVSATGAIARVDVARDLTRARVLSGTALGSDRRVGGTGSAADAFTAGHIGQVRVAGTATGSVIAAGLDPGNAIFLDADDRITGGASSTIDLVAIRRGIDDATRIVAGAVGSVRSRATSTRRPTSASASWRRREIAVSNDEGRPASRRRRRRRAAGRPAAPDGPGRAGKAADATGRPASRRRPVIPLSVPERLALGFLTVSPFLPSAVSDAVVRWEQHVHRIRQVGERRDELVGDGNVSLGAASRAHHEGEAEAVPTAAVVLVLERREGHAVNPFREERPLGLRKHAAPDDRSECRRVELLHAYRFSVKRRGEVVIAFHESHGQPSRDGGVWCRSRRRRARRAPAGHDHRKYEDKGAHRRDDVPTFSGRGGAHMTLDHK